MRSVGTTYKRATSKIIRPLYEHQDANLHDKLQLVSLQISDEPKTFGRALLAWYGSETVPPTGTA